MKGRENGKGEERPYGERRRLRNEIKDKRSKNQVRIKTNTAEYEDKNDRERKVKKRKYIGKGKRGTRYIKDKRTKNQVEMQTRTAGNREKRRGQRSKLKKC